LVAAGGALAFVAAGGALAFPRGDHFDGSAVAAPTTGDLLDRLGQHVFFFDGQLAADGVVMERPGAAADGHVEAGQVPARRAAIADHGAGAYPPLSVERMFV
jgi:hypothetical protein